VDSIKFFGLLIEKLSQKTTQKQWRKSESYHKNNAKTIGKNESYHKKP